MAAIHDISSVADFEQHAANQPPANVSFNLLPTSSLRACAALKIQVQGDNSGYRLLNPEMLDCKVRAHRYVDDGMDQVIRECTHDMERQVDDANACITRLKALLATPDDDMPEIGVPLPNRGRGLNQYIFRMPDQPNPFWDYDVVQDAQQHAHASLVTQEAARTRDRASQRALWTMNLKAQQKRKDLMTEYSYTVGRALRELKTELLDLQTLSGSGYADYRLLCHANQL